jgi:hypothetical protein
MSTHGPLFDGRADAAAQQYAESLKKAIGKKSFELVQINLQATLKNPTGFYQSHIKLRSAGSQVRLDDSDVVYGRWLEGISPRNRETRFKGYHNFRKTYYQINTQSNVIAKQMLPGYLRRMQ